MIVTLTTDFGTRDGYVAAMKGAMLSIAPGLALVDVTHEVPAQDVMEAAFVLRQAVAYYPPETVHLAVVDPGVGTARRAIAARVIVGGRPYRFVGPDNGLLALLAGADAVEAAVELDRPEAWRCDAPSLTFHGRDVFGPVAARLAAGAALADVGTPVDGVTPMHWPLPRTDDEGIDGMVLHVDQFGNCITNIRTVDLARAGDGRGVKCYAGSAIIQNHTGTYAATAVGEPVTLIGSSGYLEIAVNRGHASSLLSIQRGAPVKLVFETTRAASSSPTPA